ncbi:MAG TPA: histidine kinase [Propionicimonas sp.]|nr:histidine kinase [Propionicimonas sp.]
MRTSENRTGRLLQAAVQRGYLEPLMVGLLTLFTLALHMMKPNAAEILLDLAAMAAAALTGRWPRWGGAALAVVLVCYLPVAATWATLGVYAALVVLFCYGVRGRRRERAWFTLVYLPILWLVAGAGLPSGISVAPYLVIWTVFIGVVWLAGSAWHGLIVAAEESRLRAALEERHELARELHDSVANALANLSLRAEQAKLKGRADPDELGAIADEAARAVTEFGQIVQVLRREPQDSVDPSKSVAVKELVDAAAERLRKRGFRPNLSWDGPTPTLPAKAGHTLGRVIQEATNNMLRYGDPSAESAIVVEVSPEVAEFAFINHPKRARNGRGGGFGLTSMSERVAALGGTFSSSPAGETWLTSFRVPLAAAATTERG